MLDESYIVEGTDDPPETKEPQETPHEEPQVETPQEGLSPEQFPKVTPQQSRRTRARESNERLLAEFTGLKETITKERETYAERLQRIETENARLYGELRGYMQRPTQQAQQDRQVDPGPDPEKLLEEANEALDNRDFAKYQKKFAESVRASAVRDMQSRAPQPQQQYQGPPPVNPVLAAVMSQYTDVVTDPRGIPMAQAQDRVLDAQGLPDGPDRWNRAFTEARRVLGKKATNGKPQFSQDNRQVLSGVPATGNTSHERSDSAGKPALSALEKATSGSWERSLC